MGCVLSVFGGIILAILGYFIFRVGVSALLSGPAGIIAAIILIAVGAAIYIKLRR